MVSTRTPRCMRPRPETWNCSGVSPGSTRRATLDCSSFWRRSQIWRDVTNLPSCPAKGESLTRKVMVRVGSSISTASRATGFSEQAMVSPMSMGSRPVMAQSSPASIWSTSARPRPSKR